MSLGREQKTFLDNYIDNNEPACSIIHQIVPETLVGISDITDCIL